MAEFFSFPPDDRTDVLNSLEEFLDSLAVYLHTLKKPTKRTADISIDLLSAVFPEAGEESNLNLLARDTREAIKELQRDAAHEKLREDSLYVRRIMEELREEIRERGTFNVLTNEIESADARKNEENALFEECQKTRETLENLRRIVQEKRIENEERKKRLENEYHEEKAKAEREKLIGKMEREYLRLRRKSEREEDALREKMKVEASEKILRDASIREKSESRVKSELRAFLTQRITNLEESIGEWQARYDREKETYDKKIRQVQNEIETRRQRLKELREEYRANQEFIDSYLGEKERKRREEERREHEARCATRIQAWWKGMMVRLKLGPYRTEEKRKKRGMKSKK